MVSDDNSILKKSENYKNKTGIDFNIVENYMSLKFQKKDKIYVSNDVCVAATISKYYEQNDQYWYGYHDYQVELLKKYQKSFMAYYFRDKKEVLVIPFELMEEYRPKLNSTLNDNGSKYWHIYFAFKDGHCLWRIPKNGFLDVTDYLINNEKKETASGPRSDLKTYENEVVITIKNNNTHFIKAKNK